MGKKRGRMNKNSPFKKSPGGKMNKRGAEMTIGTIIVIILALVVLVVIIYGFVTGWGNLWQKIIGIGGVGKPNVQTHVDSCKIACASEAKSDYCKPRNVIFDDKSNQTMNCERLVSERGVSIGLDACTSINCGEISPIEGTCTGNKGKWQVGACTVPKQIDITSSLTNIADKGANDHCCKTTCTSLGGTWDPIVCDLTKFDDKAADVSDKSDNTNGLTFCCVPKVVV